MTNAETLQAWNDALVAGDIDAFLSYMSDDFSFIGPTPEPLGREAYAGMMTTLKAAFSNLNNNFSIQATEGNAVKGTVKMEGTHDGTLDLSAANGPTVEATGKSWSNPQENYVATFVDGKLARFDVDVPENGGLAGLFADLGISM